MNVHCLADISGPFFAPHKPFRNWSAFPFYQTDLPGPPYVDQAQLAWGLDRAKRYLTRIAAQGYTGIVIDNLAHLVGFEQAPVAIYPSDSPYRRRAAIYRAAFATLFDAAVQHGMDVFVTADFQWSTPPLRRYVGRLHANNPRLAALNRWALEELFTQLPQVSGLLVRVGEVGGAHNQGQDYAGHMLYTTPQRLRHLIATLLPVCASHNRLLIIRSWSIGIGELGDLMWSPARYAQTFGDLASPHLLVSIKHTPTDFFRLLPANPTLGLPGPRQLIEVQNRREYELFGMVPSSVAELHQELIVRTGSNRRFAGLWAWNATGGWGGGTAALGTDGWSCWTELSSALTAALMHDPNLDTGAFVRCWCSERFGETFGAAVAAIYLESGELFAQGWYAGPLRGASKLGRIYLPSLLWIWWMRPTASLLIWAYLASAVADVALVLAQSASACTRLSQHHARLVALAPADSPAAAAVVVSVGYLADVFAVAHAIRAFMLRAFAAAWSDQRTAWHALRAEAASLGLRLAQHRAAWAGQSDLPPLELEEIESFVQHFVRSPAWLWFQSRLACRLVAGLRSQPNVGRGIPLVGVGATALLLLSLCCHGRRMAGITGLATLLLLISPLRQPLLDALLPWLSRRFHLLPSIFFETGPAFKEWMA